VETSERAKDKLVNEILALSSLADSYYVEEFVKTEHNLWLVQPFYNGGNLQNLIEKHPNGIDPEKLKYITFQIVDAFSFLLRKNLL